MLKNLKHDIPAGLVVFLVALPLCLGVALASGAPLLAGVISGVVGGVIVGFLSQSHVSVSGPAAGMAAVVLSAITQLVQYEVFLLAVFLSGLIQLAGGFAKGGFLANYIPSNVIKGLLAAIGIILILKQIPHAVGFDRDVEDDFTFMQRDGENTFSELLNVFYYFSWGAIIISLLSLPILIFWEKVPLKSLKLIPASLIVVILGVIVNEFMLSIWPDLALSSSHLVAIPPIHDLSSAFTLPDFTQIGNSKVWVVAFTIAVIASVETLLNLEAVEKIDPKKRFASPNRELVAQGVGNMVSGLIGGIPLTSVIVRGSVNIYAGAVSKFSTIIHGMLLLLSVLFLSSFLNLIPLASLASILIYTGYKLAPIQLFKDMFLRGANQFIPFAATIVAIVFSDLLTGVMIGLAISIFFILKSNFNNPFELDKETLHVDETIRIELPKQVSFLNKALIKETLWNIPSGSKVVIDASNNAFMDFDVQEIIDDFNTTVAHEKGIKINLLGFHQSQGDTEQIEFVDVLDKATQQKLTPDEVLEILKKGNDRFVTGRWTEKYLRQQMAVTSLGQNPFAIVLSCIDSRTTTEHIFDLGLGDIFSVRIAGNVLNEDILGSMEFGVHVVGVKLIVVLGHTKCGAIVGACNQVELGNLTTLLSKVKPAIEREKTISIDRNGANLEFVNLVAEQNVFCTMDRIQTESEIIAEAMKKGKIKIVGAMYNVETGEVKFYDYVNNINSSI